MPITVSSKKRKCPENESLQSLPRVKKQKQSLCELKQDPTITDVQAQISHMMCQLRRLVRSRTSVFHIKRLLQEVVQFAKENKDLRSDNLIQQALIQQRESSEDNTFFEEAVASKKPQLIKMCLAFKPDITATDNQGNIALHSIIAMYYKVNSNIELLLSKSSVNLQNNKGRTALHEVVEKTPYLTGMFLQAGADPNIADNEGNCALHIGVRGKNHFILEKLLNYGADSNFINKMEYTALQEAIKAHCAHSVQILLKHQSTQSFNLNRQDTQGNTYLHFAVQHQAPMEIIEMLLAHHINPYLCNEKGESALEIAQYMRPDITEALLRLLEPCIPKVGDTSANHPNMLFKTQRELSTLMQFPSIQRRSLQKNTTLIALSKQNITVQIIESALQNNAVLDVCDQEGRTPIHHMIIQKSEEDVALFIGDYLKKSDNHLMNMKDNKGVTILMQAIISQQFQWIDALHSLQFNKTIQDNQGDTIIHMAMNYTGKHTVFMHPFLNHLISTENLNIQNKVGQTALHKAILAENTIGLMQLLEKRANVHIPDIKNRTPLILAIQKKYSDFVQQLLEAGALPDALQGSRLQSKSYNMTVTQCENHQVHLGICQKCEVVQLTPLEIAIKDVNLKIVRLLLNAGAKHNISSKNFASALHCVVQITHPQNLYAMIDCFIKYGHKPLTNDINCFLEILIQRSRTEKYKIDYSQSFTKACYLLGKTHRDTALVSLNKAIENVDLDNMKCLLLTQESDCYNAPSKIFKSAIYAVQITHPQNLCDVIDYLIRYGNNPFSNDTDRFLEILMKRSNTDNYETDYSHFFTQACAKIFSANTILKNTTTQPKILTSHQIGNNSHRQLFNFQR